MTAATEVVEVAKTSLWDLRKARGLTRVQLANEIGVSAGVIYMWERKQTRPRDYLLERLTAFFDCDVGDFDLADKKREGRPSVTRPLFSSART